MHNILREFITGESKMTWEVKPGEEWRIQTVSDYQTPLIKIELYVAYV